MIRYALDTSARVQPACSQRLGGSGSLNQTSNVEGETKEYKILIEQSARVLPCLTLRIHSNTISGIGSEILFRASTWLLLWSMCLIHNFSSRRSRNLNSTQSVAGFLPPPLHLAT